MIEVEGKVKVKSANMVCYKPEEFLLTWHATFRGIYHTIAWIEEGRRLY